MSVISAVPTALVTGASSGIGAVYAERLAARGHDLLLVARDRQRLEALASDLQARHGINVEVLAADLAQANDLARVEQRLRDDEQIGVLVNNAGIALHGTLAEATPAQIESLVALNIVAVTRLAAAAADRFSGAGRGTIINIASVVALAPEMFNAVYSASKAYVLSLSQTLHGELKDKGVQVQVVLPGVTRTEIFERSGLDVTQIDPQMVMEVGEMVDAALSGLDQKELVTIPSLPQATDWQAYIKARDALGPNLSRSSAAARYK
ncbi:MULTISPECIES: SDR family oxidoreductase [unclassified Pseudomonas]|uniref:SDR family NAD(P)-dependent oxidoreductase n=1 Tax=unclassified Pseudomonas TaxID=196821 RepID=UPI00100C74E6|nr:MULTISPECIES: SDR family oxidoreductase [unclassified Pseudomonas]MCE5981355.1 SDR family oxidoreductase [Pseudomonas sp. LF19]SPO65748.1 putative oxidoreductase [Pseudomonas sp. JV241A]